MYLFYILPILECVIDTFIFALSVSSAPSCLTLCNPMDYSMPGFPVHHQLPEHTQTHVHQVGDATHLILCHPILLPPSISPSISIQSQFFISGSQSIGVSAKASALPMNIQDWFPLGWTGWISLQSNGLASLLQHQVQKHQFFITL